MDGRTTRLNDVPKVLVGALTEPGAMQRSPRSKSREKTSALQDWPGFSQDNHNYLLTCIGEKQTSSLFSCSGSLLPFPVPTSTPLQPWFWSLLSMVRRREHGALFWAAKSRDFFLAHVLLLMEQTQRKLSEVFFLLCVFSLEFMLSAAVETVLQRQKRRMSPQEHRGKSGHLSGQQKPKRSLCLAKFLTVC